MGAAQGKSPFLVVIKTVTLEILKILVCHVIFQDHVIKGSYDFKGRSKSSKLPFCQNLVALGTMVGDITV